MVKYGVIAVGGNRTHQESYAREFASDPRCELIAVADEPGLPEYREGLNRLLASELGVPYLPLDEALARDDVHIIDNCADVERRARVALKTLEAGKHLYMDKPLAASVEEAHAIAEAAEKSDSDDADVHPGDYQLGASRQVGNRVRAGWRGACDSL